MDEILLGKDCRVARIWDAVEDVVGVHEADGVLPRHLVVRLEGWRCARVEPQLVGHHSEVDDEARDDEHHNHGEDPYDTVLVSLLCYARIEECPEKQ